MPDIVNIPGGTATLRDPRALLVKHRNPMQICMAQIGETRGKDIREATLAGQELVLTETEHGISIRLTEAIVFALLQSWTLPDPLPTCINDIEDLPVRVYDTLSAECARRWAVYMEDQPTDETGEPIDPFSVAAVEDLTSPTGASAGSKGPSAVVARRVPSDRKKPSGGRSTGTGKRSA